MNKIDSKVEEIRGTIIESMDLDEETKRELGAIELNTMEYSLADAIREGSGATEQAYNWGDGETACAMSAAVLAAKARGFM